MSRFSTEDTTRLERWLHDLDARHLANLRFSEVTRALRAVSAGYVEQRQTLRSRSPFDGSGKQAAYALFYGPLHFLTVQAIVRHLPGATDSVAHLADWGCGTGAAGAAWALTMSPPRPRISGTDVHPWAVSEAAATYRLFGLKADVRRAALLDARLPPSVDALVAGWVINEVDETSREKLLPRFMNRAARGMRILIVEPIATSITPWWTEWERTFQSAGGRADEWRFRIELPELVRRLDKASGMRHDELTARSLWITPSIRLS